MKAQMTELHLELLRKCLVHDIRWLDNLIAMGFSGDWRDRVIRPFFKLFVTIAKQRIRLAGVDIKSE